ncbi:hypothetical protein GA0061101_14032 [Rhizobium lusitanum]|uniref:Secreted protein n=1 Tax=Rhizobium lusitanum TaxID=293958 RepID=A0A1C3XGW6_9HYPH|nr:hypothetical protein GA0061101_14032 [Rhizobium lusitanum]
MASLKVVMPALPVAAAASANHLAGPDFRLAAVASTSQPMPTLPAGTASNVSASAQASPGSSPWCCGRSSATSTTICFISAGPTSRHGSAINSSPTMRLSGL